MDMKLDGEIVRTFLPRMSLGIFTTNAMFNKVRLSFLNQSFDVKCLLLFVQTDEYVIYYNSGMQSIYLFRVRDGTQLGVYVVQSELRCINTSHDGRFVIFGTGDGSVSTLAIADPNKKDSYKSIRSFSSRQIND